MELSWDQDKKTWAHPWGSRFWSPALPGSEIELDEERKNGKGKGHRWAFLWERGQVSDQEGQSRGSKQLLFAGYLPTSWCGFNDNQCSDKRQLWWLGHWTRICFLPQVTGVELLALGMGYGIMRLTELPSATGLSHVAMSTAIIHAKESGCCFWQS